MDIKIISQNIKNNPQDFSAEQIEQLFKDYAEYVITNNLEEILRKKAEKKFDDLTKNLKNVFDDLTKNLKK